MRITPAGRRLIEAISDRGRIYPERVCVVGLPKNEGHFSAWEDITPANMHDRFEKAYVVVDDAFERDTFGYVDSLNVANLRAWKSILPEYVVNTDMPGWNSGYEPLCIDLLAIDDDVDVEDIADSLESHCDYPIGADLVSDVEQEDLEAYANEDLIDDVRRSLGDLDGLIILAENNESLVQEVFFDWERDGFYTTYEYRRPYWSKSEWKDLIVTVARALYSRGERAA